MAYYPKMKIYVTTINPTSATTIKNTLDSQILENDKYIDEGDFNQIRIIDVHPLNSSLGILVEACIRFVSQTKADDIYTFISKPQNRPADTFGKISFHLCPEKGTIQDWQGCNVDSRAQYREILWQ